ncbi:MAG: group II truncated hemoglobin [Hyphomicrobiaceae bacterium]|nr:group II truncated hemoglobin [Hyphomicrobiaceae bacterium]
MDPADAASGQTTTLYDLLGGEPALRKLTRRMYELMATLPEAAAARNVHPPDLAGSEQKFFEFMSGWLGGPPLFVEKRGPPMLRRRHFVAKIGKPEIAAWLRCFEGAMDETVADAKLREALREPIRRLAHHMQNTD